MPAMPTIQTITTLLSTLNWWEIILIWSLSLTISIIFMIRNQDPSRTRQLKRNFLHLITLYQHLKRRLREFRESEREVQDEMIRQLFGFGNREEDGEEDDALEGEDNDLEDKYEDEEDTDDERDRDELINSVMGQDRYPQAQEGQEEENEDERDDDWDALSDSHSDVTTSTASFELSSGSDSPLSVREQIQWNMSL